MRNTRLPPEPESEGGVRKPGSPGEEGALFYLKTVAKAAERAITSNDTVAGIMIGSGFLPRACPTALAAPGLLTCPATQA